MIIATGSVAKPILGLQFGGRVLGTETTWALDELPKRIAVSAPARRAPRSRPPSAGSAPRSSLLEALPQILPLEDKDIARAAAREIAKQNVKIVTDANIDQGRRRPTTT